MARMLPHVVPEELKHESEQEVYRQLRDQLPKTYTVLHSYPWLKQKGKRLHEGEADFVVLHPQRGLLVLEVKGGQLLLQDHTWYRQTAARLKPVQDPFDQARGNMYDLLERVAQQSRIKLSDWNMAYGYAVVFPHDNYTGQLPANADKAIIISQRDFSNMESAIEKAYGAWTSIPRTLTDRSYQLLLDILLPKFRLIRPIGPDIDSANQRLLELTIEQQATFEGLYSNSRVLVEGTAGTGKTVLALQRALSFAQQGHRCLFVCFNVELAKWLREKIASDPAHADYAERINIKNFHALAYEVAERAGIEFPIPKDPAAAKLFWDEEVVDILEQSAMIVKSSGEFCYSAIVVDEAQDFCELWWYALTESFLENPETDPLYVFMDANQKLKDSASPLPIDIEVRFQLRRNCRNVQKIAKTCAKLRQLDTLVLSSLPMGKAPLVIQAESPKQQQKAILQQLQQLISLEKLSAEKIVVIGPKRKENGSLADVNECAGVPFVTQAEVWRRGEGILITTARSFKGLEADVVILYDIGKLNGYFTDMDLYVACSRARYLLVVVVYDESMKILIESSVEL